MAKKRAAADEEDLEEKVVNAFLTHIEDYAEQRRLNQTALSVSLNKKLLRDYALRVLSFVAHLHISFRLKLTLALLRVLMAYGQRHLVRCSVGNFKYPRICLRKVC